MDKSIEHTQIMCRALIVESERNGPVVLVYDWDSWPRRVRESRGWHNGRVLYHRPATEQERKLESGNTRCKCYVYDSIESLIEDEARFGIDARELLVVPASVSHS